MFAPGNNVGFSMTEIVNRLCNTIWSIFSTYNNYTTAGHGELSRPMLSCKFTKTGPTHLPNFVGLQFSHNLIKLLALQKLSGSLMLFTGTRFLPEDRNHSPKN